MRLSRFPALLGLLVACASSPRGPDLVAREARPLDTPVGAHPDQPLPAATAEYAALTLGAELAAELGLGPEDLAATPPLGRQDVEILAPWLDLEPARRCLKQRDHGRGRVTADRRWVSFVARAEGGVADVRVETVPGGEGEAACVGAALSSRTLPRLRVGGRTWLRLEGTGARAPAEAEAMPSFDGYVPPKQAWPGCVEAWLQHQGKLAARFPGTLNARFTVEQDGSVTRFTLGPPGFAVEVGSAVKRAVTSCPWVPALDPSGKPASVWVVLPVRFVAVD